jgi:hypothetical protein
VVSLLCPPPDDCAVFLAAARHRLPLKVILYDRAVFVGVPAVSTALAACMAWFIVVLGMVLWRATPAARPRAWPPALVFAVFVGFSVGGGAASVVKSLCALPAVIAEVAHWIAFTPAVGAVFGAYLLRSPYAGRSRRACHPTAENTRRRNGGCDESMANTRFVSFRGACMT